MSFRPFIVGIGGTTRKDSTTERALQHALASAGRAGADTQMFGGAALPIEPYDPSAHPHSRAALDLVEALGRADGVLVASPSYHGSLSGLVKNALDYAEELREQPRPYFDGRAVGCIVVAEGPQAMGPTLIALRAIVHSLRGWPTPYAATVDSRTQPFGADGRGVVEPVAAALDLVARQVVDFARMRDALARSAG